jgi:hypothetical protein
MLLAPQAAVLAPQAAVLAQQAAVPARQVAGLAARWLPAPAWAQPDLPPRDLSVPERPGSCLELPGDFAQAAGIARPALTQALVSRQKR